MSRCRDLNPGPLPYQGSALPLSYIGLSSYVVREDASSPRFRLRIRWYTDQFGCKYTDFSEYTKTYLRFFPYPIGLLGHSEPPDSLIYRTGAFPQRSPILGHLCDSELSLLIRLGGKRGLTRGQASRSHRRSDQQRQAEPALGSLRRAIGVQVHRPPTLGLGE